MPTKFFAKVLGLWTALTVIGMAANRDATIETMGRMYADPLLLFVVGLFTVLVGLVVVVAHNRWTGGLLPIVVTLYGWLTLIRGVLYVSFSPPARLAFWEMLHFEQLFYVYLLVALILSAYLIYGGFKREPSS
jgi:hypothetical protein